MCGDHLRSQRDYRAQSVPSISVPQAISAKAAVLKDREGSKRQIEDRLSLVSFMDCDLG
jgi:hypothetical protein